mmetsp:Transcript_23490/g.73669  ORF Transcript_23490/g.73669 Transcript_23490/m.73669 type:complete len:340 (-) Transcript_23490:163-1182(-)
MAQAVVDVAGDHGAVPVACVELRDESAAVRRHEVSAAHAALHGLHGGAPNPLPALLTRCCRFVLCTARVAAVFAAEEHLRILEPQVLNLLVRVRIHKHVAGAHNKDELRGLHGNGHGRCEVRGAHVEGRARRTVAHAREHHEIAGVEPLVDARRLDATHFAGEAVVYAVAHAHGLRRKEAGAADDVAAGPTGDGLEPLAQHALDFESRRTGSLLHDAHRLFVGDANAVGKHRLVPARPHAIVDQLSAAEHDHQAHAEQPHQREIIHHGAERLRVIDHVPRKVNEHAAPAVPMDVRRAAPQRVRLKNAIPRAAAEPSRHRREVAVFNVVQAAYHEVPRQL